MNHDYSPKPKNAPKKTARDTSTDWITIPRLSLFTAVAFIATLITNGASYVL